MTVPWPAIVESREAWVTVVAAVAFAAGVGVDQVVTRLPRSLTLSGSLPDGAGRLQSLRRALPFLCSVLSVLTAWRLGPGWLAMGVLIFVWVLLALVFIDLETFLLPDVLTLPLMWGGLLANSRGLVTDLHAALWGAAGGYFLLWAVYWIYRWLARREGIGRGDFKLLAALGAWMGWEALPLILLCASLAGVVVGGFWLRCGRHSRHTPIPFGPFLAVAGYGVMLWGKGGLPWANSSLG